MNRKQKAFLSHTDGACQVCRAKVCLFPFASYTRYLVEWVDEAPVTHDVNQISIVKLLD